MPRLIELLGDDDFEHRHIGPRSADVQRMLEVIGVDSVEALIAEMGNDVDRTRTILAVEDGGVDSGTA